MENLVIINNGQPVTNSLLVADKFQKEHRHILDAIRDLIKGSAEFSAHPMFEETTYTHPQNGQSYPMYLMNRDGFSLLVMGFTGEKALRFKLDYIEAFNKMEAHIKSGGFQIPKSYAEALQLAAKQAEQIEANQKQIEAGQVRIAEMRPKEVFTDAVVGSQNSCLIGELAKILRQNGVEVGEKRLFQWLRDNGYLGRCGERYNIPNQQYIEQGLFELKKGVRTGDNGVLHTTITPKVTGKGQVYFVNKFLKAA